MSSLRKCTGGYHANSFRSCFIGTVSIYLIYIKLIYPYLLNNIKINMIVFLVSAMVIFVLGAVNHPGMDWNKEEFEENKKLARITVFVELLVAIADTRKIIIFIFILLRRYGYINFIYIR